jgi:hypothetical protein
MTLMPLSLKDKEVRVVLLEALQRKYPEYSDAVSEHGVSFVTLARDPGTMEPGDDAEDLDVPSFEAYIDCSQQELKELKGECL